MADRSTPEEIGGRLRKLRGDMRLEDFAAELGCTKTDYIDYEAGTREIPISVLFALIERGGIDPIWVLTGKRVDHVAESSQTAGIAYAAILEAAQRAGITLMPSALTYAIKAAWPVVIRTKSIDAEHADVLVKLATINGDRLP